MFVLEIYLIVINIAAFIMYGLDKKRAIQKAWRISEKALLGAAFAGGALGAYLGMQFFRHKTKHAKFNLLVPASMVLWMVILWKVL